MWMYKFSSFYPKLFFIFDGKFVIILYLCCFLLYQWSGSVTVPFLSGLKETKKTKGPYPGVWHGFYGFILWPECVSLSVLFWHGLCSPQFDSVKKFQLVILMWFLCWCTSYFWYSVISSFDTLIRCSGCRFWHKIKFMLVFNFWLIFSCLNSIHNVHIVFRVIVFCPCPLPSDKPLDSR